MNWRDKHYVTDIWVMKKTLRKLCDNITVASICHRCSRDLSKLRSTLFTFSQQPVPNKELCYRMLNYATRTLNALVASSLTSLL